MLSKSRSVRIAVNVCVIGALLVPNPALGTAFAGDCDSTIASTHKCEGCGRCSVADTGDRCVCCRKNPVRSVEPAKTCCTKKKCCRSTAAALSPNKNSTEAEVSSCQCGRSPQPTTPPPPTRSAAEKLTELISASAVLYVSHICGESHFSSHELEFVPLILLSRDTQRHLCVWRI